MKKSISMRELILLGILVIIAAYYFVVQGPVAEEKTSIDSMQAQIDMELDEAEARLINMRRMEKAVDEVFAEDPDPAQVISEYNNINNILLELNTILDSTIDYTIDFETEEIASEMARRNINIYFAVGSYEAAIEKITAIESSSNRYLIRNMSITDGAGRASDAGFEVTLNVTSFEYVKAS